MSSVKAKKNEKKIRSAVFRNSKSKCEEITKKRLPGIWPGWLEVSVCFFDGFEDVPCGREEFLG